MFKQIQEDIQTVFEKDPAARSTLEVVTCYPGLHATWMHRIAHTLWKLDLLWFARFLSHISRFMTGIEIHPGAEIGRRFFIDHGSGVVIGETTKIGDDVVLYQNCTLGGTSAKQEKRHPTVEDNVVIGAGSVLLGPIQIGHNSKIGAGSVVLDSIKPNSTVVGVPATLAGEPEQTDISQLNHGDISYPVKEALTQLEKQYEDLENRLEKIENNTKKQDKSR